MHNKRNEVGDILHKTRKTAIGCWLLVALGTAAAAPEQGETARPPATQHPATTQQRFPIPAFRLSGNRAIGDDELQALLAPLTGLQRDARHLLAARDQVEAHYHQRGYPLVKVALPETLVPGEAIPLTIIEARTGPITVSGAKHFSTAPVQEALSADQPRGEIIRLALFQAQQVLNQNPARGVGLKFVGEPNGETRIEAIVQDEKPWSVGLDLDNSGSAITGHTRLGINAQHADLFDRGIVGSANYVVSPEKPDAAQAVLGNLTLPFPTAGGLLGVQASYSQGDTLNVANVFGIHGKHHLLGFNWQHLLPAPAVELPATRLQAGLSWRHYQNGLDFLGTPVNDNRVGAAPLALGVVRSLDAGNASALVSLGLTANIPGLGADNDNASYAAMRADAKAQWAVFRATIAYANRFSGGGTLDIAFSGQLASGPLIPAEQFGLGGSLAVRGFNEFDSAGDHGARLNFELTSAPWFGHSRLAAFADAGWRQRLQAQALEKSEESIASIGIGYRLTLDRNLSLKLDAAHVLDGSETTRAGENHVHARLQLRF
ncbi:hypothetical protein GBK02_06885 [Dechloromonas sp. TW-R-39-2]|nr:hypothetical protein GBK02_06885 [Dechloromonas sp. TW-R-39-2]